MWLTTEKTAQGKPTFIYSHAGTALLWGQGKECFWILGPGPTHIAASFLRTQPCGEPLGKFFPIIKIKPHIQHFITHFIIFSKYVKNRHFYPFHPIYILQPLMPLPPLYLVFAITAFCPKEMSLGHVQEKRVSLVYCQHYDFIWISHVHTGACKIWDLPAYSHSCHFLRHILSHELSGYQDIYP